MGTGFINNNLTMYIEYSDQWLICIIIMLSDFNFNLKYALQDLNIYDIERFDSLLHGHLAQYLTDGY